MGSVLRAVRPRKPKSRRLGEVEVIDRSSYEAMDLDTRVELILGLIPLGLMHVSEVLEDEVRVLAGEKHARKGDGEVRVPIRHQPGQRAARRSADRGPGTAGSGEPG